MSASNSSSFSCDLNDGSREDFQQVFFNAWSDLFASILINGLLLVLLVSIFEALRKVDKLDFYRARTLARNRKNFAKLREAPPPALPSGFLAWVPIVHRMSDERFLDLAGLDAYVLLRFLRLCFRMCLSTAFFGILVLTPIYATASGEAEGVNRITMANLENDSPRVWACVIFAYLYTFHMVFMLKTEYATMSGLRSDFLARGDKGVDRQTSYTVMVEKLPEGCRTDVALRTFFSEMFPDQVHSAHVCLDLYMLQALQRARDRTLRRLEVAIIANRRLKEQPKLLVNPNREMEEVGRGFPCFGGGKGVEVDAVEFLTRKLQLQHNLIAEEITKIAEERGRAEREEAETLDHTKAEGDEEALLELYVARFAPGTTAVLPTDGEVAPSAPGDAVQQQPLPQPAQEGAEQQQGGEAEHGGESLSTLHSKEPPAPRPASLRSQHQQADSSSIDATARAIYSAVDYLAGGAVDTSRGMARTVQLLAMDSRPGTGFVTFKNLRSRASACQLLLTDAVQSFEVSQAKESRDIVWSNVTVNASQIRFRNFALNMMLLIFVFLWFPLVTALLNLQKLILHEWKDATDTGLRDFFGQYFVTLLLLIVISILPLIFRALSYLYVKEKSMSHVELRLVLRFFSFQVRAPCLATLSAA
jgi:hypothetical protein